MTHGLATDASVAHRLASNTRLHQHGAGDDTPVRMRFAVEADLQSLVDGVEFRIITTWDSMAAIKRFAGESPETAVVPEKVQAMMVSYDRTVDHYEVVA